MRLSGRLTTALAALLVALLAAATTYALWDGGVPLGSGHLVAGNLDVALQGTATWEETSADVVGTPRAIDPATFRAAAGDSVRVTQDLTTTLEGDNIGGRITVSWADGADAAAGVDVSGTYTLLNGSGSVVSGAQDVPLGTPTTLSKLPAGGQSWTLVVDLSLDAAPVPVYVAPSAAATATPTVADLGGLAVDLEQVRYAGTAAMHTLVDSFTNASYTSSTWNGVGSPGIALTGTSVQIRGYSSGTFLSSRNAYNLTSSSICVGLLSQPQTGRISVILSPKAAPPLTTADQLALTHQSPNLRAERQVNGSMTTSMISYSPMSSVQWRIRHDGSNVVWEATSGSSSWTTVGSAPAPFALDELYVHLMAQSSDGSALATVYDVNQCV